MKLDRKENEKIEAFMKCEQTTRPWKARKGISDKVYNYLVMKEWEREVCGDSRRVFSAQA